VNTLPRSIHPAGTPAQRSGPDVSEKEQGRVSVRLRIAYEGRGGIQVTAGHSLCYAKPHLMMHALQVEKWPADPFSDSKAQCPHPYHPALLRNDQTHSWSFNVFYAFLTSHQIIPQKTWCWQRRRDDAADVHVEKGIAWGLLRTWPLTTAS